MEPRQQRAAWAAATVAGVLVAFAPAVIGLRTLSRHDTDRLYAPVRTLVVQELRAGRLPLWNPYEGTGKPLFAEGIHSVLHPLSLLGAAVAPSSIDFLILAYLVAAALGAFVLAWALGASAPASAGAGLAFALSGYSTSMTGNLVFLAGLSTLPWLLAAARASGAGTRWGTVATAVATACAFLSGDVQIAIVGVALGALLAADAGGARGAARVLAGTVAGFLLAGVQIAATRELLPRTFRSLDLSPWEKTRWSLAPARLLEWVVPGLFRGPLSLVPERTSGEWIDFEFADSVYLGAPLLVAAAAGATATAARRRTRLLLGIAVVVLLWLAFGHHLGARQVLDRVPVWNRFRFSEKLVAPLTICASALAALGVDALATGRLSRPWRRALAAVAVVAGVLLLVLLLAPGATKYLATRLLGDAGPFYRSNLAAGLPHLAIGLGALLAADRLTRPAARTAALALLVALAPAAAASYGAHLGAPDARRRTSPLRLDSDSPVPRIAQAAEPPYGAEQRRAYVNAYARYGSTLLVPSFNVAQRVDTEEAYGAFWPRRLMTLNMTLLPVPARAFRRFALTHVVVPIPAGEPDAEAIARAVEGGRLVQRDDERGFELWAVPHRPWAFFARNAVARTPPQEAHRVLLDLLGRDDDATVVVEAAEPPPTAPGRVLRAERAVGSLAVEGETEAPALLVVQDAWWPGWRASIDGQPAEILTADILVRAVRWPPGRHRLEMVYDPPGVRFGLALSALGAALVILLAIFAARSPSTAVLGR